MFATDCDNMHILMESRAITHTQTVSHPRLITALKKGAGTNSAEHSLGHLAIGS